MSKQTLTVDGHNWNAVWIGRQKSLSAFLATDSAKNAYPKLDKEQRTAILEKVYSMVHGEAKPKKSKSTKKAD